MDHTNITTTTTNQEGGVPSPSSTAPATAPANAPAPATTTATSSSSGVSRRCIYSNADLEKFLASPAKRDLMHFVRALGHACATTTTTDNTNPLQGLSPAMACLYGALQEMQTIWINDIRTSISISSSSSSTLAAGPRSSHVRFGDPQFRAWHARLVARSGAILTAILAERPSSSLPTSSSSSSTIITDEPNADGQRPEETRSMLLQLQGCQQRGAAAAATKENTPSTHNTGGGDDDATNNNTTTANNNTTNTTATIAIAELQGHFHDAFGHPVRLDYGTGHETSFVIVLFALGKLGALEQHPSTTTTPTTTTTTCTTTTEALAATTRSIFSIYLTLTRSLQTRYRLEPAGSQGVWGLDDHCCLPYYFGACQLQNPHTVRELLEGEGWDVSKPSCIHDAAMVQRLGGGTDDMDNNNNDSQQKQYMLLYFGCIQFIKSIKRDVPFFESSPMLNDISAIPTWSKVSAGLLKLYEGEVLSKRPAVQHIQFGPVLFPANWTPSETDAARRQAPTTTFRVTPTTPNTAASSSISSTPAAAAATGEALARLSLATPAPRAAAAATTTSANAAAFSPTRAPWAPPE